MSEPILWIAGVFATVALCTLHLCYGLRLGRQLGRSEVLERARRTFSADDAADVRHEASAAKLTAATRDLSHWCNTTSAQVPVDLQARIERLCKGIGDLQGDIAASIELHRRRTDELLNGDSSARRTTSACRDRGTRGSEPVVNVDGGRPNSPIGSSDWPATPMVALKTLSRNGGTGGRSATARCPKAAPGARSCSECGKCWSGLSAEEVEQMRSAVGSASEATSSSPNEIRVDGRYPYPTEQFVAEVTGAEFPPPETFVPVRCRYLSRESVIYFTSTDPPTRNSIVITLGTLPDLKFFKADVESVRLSYVDGAEGVTVNCRLVCRIGCGVYAWDYMRRRIVREERACGLELELAEEIQTSPS